MLFNSIEFLIFLVVVFALYWFVVNKKHKLQNLLILVSSYVFYGWWDWRFLALIFLSTIVDYSIGERIYRIKNAVYKKRYLWISVLFNLGVLGFFKYYNFFIESWVDLISNFGYEIKSIWTLKIILPVGISFYTFQTMSYTIDIYKGKLRPTSDFIAFASFVSFFPQLVAGPIERAANLLPQFTRERKFNFSWDPIYLIFTGFLRKVVFADNLSFYVDQSWNNLDRVNLAANVISVLFFSFQIYFDFSGYSRIARGIAKLFGFELMTNFNYPYTAKTLSEFWNRWHISLSTWFRDYVYYPLGGNKISDKRTYVNLFVVFMVSGLWHGAHYNFLVWGFIHAMFIVVEKRFRMKTGWLSTFVIVALAWVPFRSGSFTSTKQFVKGFLKLPHGLSDLLIGVGYVNFAFLISLFCFSLIYLKLERKKSDLIYLMFPVLIFFFTKIGESFIYFQF